MEARNFNGIQLFCEACRKELTFKIGEMSPWLGDECLVVKPCECYIEKETTPASD